MEMSAAQRRMGKLPATPTISFVQVPPPSPTTADLTNRMARLSLAPTRYLRSPIRFQKTVLELKDCNVQIIPGSENEPRKFIVDVQNLDTAPHLRRDFYTFQVRADGCSEDE